MQIIEWPEFLENGLPLGEKFSSLTVGVFDGVHLGHQALIRRVVSRNRNYVPAAITFVQNHKKASGGIKEYPGDIQSFRQKTAMFESLGLEMVLAAEFTESFRQMSGNEFMRILLDRCKIGFFAVGSDFRCGYRLDTDASAIRQFFESRNIPVEIVADVMEGSKPVSSSRIRDAIVQGKLKHARAMLGYPFTLELSANPQGEVSRAPGADADFSGSESGGVYRFVDQGLVLPPEGRYPVILREKPAEPSAGAEGIANESSRGSPPDNGTAAEIIVEKGLVRIPLSGYRWESAEFIN